MILDALILVVLGFFCLRLVAALDKWLYRRRKSKRPS